MRVLVAGASGTIGSHLVPLLVAAGHRVVGTTVSARRAGALRALGAAPVVVDALDPESVADAVAKAEPEVIVHQLAAPDCLPERRRTRRTAALGVRLRTEGTDHLLAAAQAVGVRAFVARSDALWMERAGGPVATENGRLDPRPPADVAATVAALRHLEKAVTGISWAEGIALRYGAVYGAGTGITSPYHTERIRRRRLPVVGDGRGVWSLVHIADVAAATVAAVERGRRGVYHVADDEPAAVRVWLPHLARALGAGPPRRVPAWQARLLAGPGLVDMMTRARGVSCEYTKRELGWAPRYPSWRTGFTEGLV